MDLSKQLQVQQSMEKLIKMCWRLVREERALSKASMGEKLWRLDDFPVTTSVIAKVRRKGMKS